MGITRRDALVPNLGDYAWPVTVFLARLKPQLDSELFNDIVFAHVQRKARAAGKGAKADAALPSDQAWAQVAVEPYWSDLPLFRNIDALGELLALTSTERHLLAFLVLLHTSKPLRRVCDSIHIDGASSLTDCLSSALRITGHELRPALHQTSALRTTRLLEMGRSYGDSVSERLQLMDDLGDILRRPYRTLAELMGNFCQPAKAPTLSLSHYPHLKADIDLIMRYLTQALAKQTVGCNILLYGVPGTGKTELAAALAKKLGKNLFQVPYADELGDTMSASERLAAFQLGQRFLSQQPGSILLFDEIEDVFPLPGLFPSKSDSFGKSWMTALLENNPLPTIWICNSTWQIDPAYRRRFAYSIEFTAPPIAVRRQILQQYLGELSVSEQLIERIALHPELTPAQIASAGKVVSLIGYRDKAAESALVRTLGNSATLLDQADLPREDENAAHYDLSYLNTDPPLNELVAQCQRSQAAANMVFYGVPGTGKTQLGHYLALQLQRPLIIKRASDLLGPYVGQTEQAIAQMFRQASDDQAVLLLDEADSFLRDRTHARQSWEVTQVNELLTQMERFEGIFICTTNLMCDLDAASLRRFSLKVRFDYLNAEQRWLLFRSHWQAMAKATALRLRKSLDAMNTLTPGDFATVRKQLKLLGLKPEPNDFLQRLQRECSAKTESVRRPMGFLSQL